MTRLKEVWQNKQKILQGISNYLLEKIGQGKASKMAKNRILICQSNKCGFYDKFGESSKVFIKGKPACGVCGCNIKLLTHSQDSKCSLWEIGQEPLWLEEKL